MSKIEEVITYLNWLRKGGSLEVDDINNMLVKANQLRPYVELAKKIVEYYNVSEFIEEKENEIQALIKQIEEMENEQER